MVIDLYISGYQGSNNMTMVMVNRSITIKYSHKVYISNEIKQIGK